MAQHLAAEVGPFFRLQQARTHSDRPPHCSDLYRGAPTQTKEVNPMKMKQNNPGSVNEDVESSLNCDRGRVIS